MFGDYFATASEYYWGLATGETTDEASDCSFDQKFLHITGLLGKLYQVRFRDRLQVPTHLMGQPAQSVSSRRRPAISGIAIVGFIGEQTQGEVDIERGREPLGGHVWSEQGT